MLHPPNLMRHWLRHFARVQIMTGIVTVLLIVLWPVPSHGITTLTARRTAQEAIAQAARRAPLSVAPGIPRSAVKKTLALPTRILLQVPLIDQLPALYNGCEVTSLAMLLQFEHINVTNLTLAAEVKRDPTPLVTNSEGDIVSWGNPNTGFVGSISGKEPGYGVYHGPIAALLNRYMPGQALDLTGSNLATILATVASGRPVIMWTTLNFQPANDWITWQSPTGPVRATMTEHAVLFVGYDKTDAFVNDPLTGQLDAEPLASFRTSWIDLGRQAVTVAPQPPKSN